MSVSEVEIGNCIAQFLRHHHKVIEGAAAVAVAAALKDTECRKAGSHGSAPIAIVACGGNIAHESLLHVLNDEVERERTGN